MGLGLKFRPLHMEIDFLLTKFEGATHYRGRSTHEGFELHAQNSGVKINAGRFTCSGEHQVVKVVNHLKTKLENPVWTWFDCIPVIQVNMIA